VNSEKIKKLGLGFLKYVGTLVTGLVLTALIKGESLAGLTRLRTLLPFLKTSVPLWAFLLLLLFCVYMARPFINSLRKRPVLHVSWERLVCLWALGRFGDKPMMQIQGHAIITSSGTDETIIIREAYVKGTEPLQSIIDDVVIPPGEPQTCRIATFVHPVIRKPDEGLETSLILRDHKGREYRTPKVLFKSGNPPKK
jgi:hypothetical protein